MFTFNLKRISNCILLVIIFVLNPIDIIPATSDSSAFGNSARISAGSNNDFAFDSSIQPDGKIVIAGFSMGGDFYQHAVLVRLLPDGKLDSSFGNGGKLQPDLGDISSAFFSVLALADGRILVAGRISTSLGDDDFLIIRLNSDGTFDFSFGVNGIVTTDLDEDDSFSNIVLQPDGKIVAAGSSGVFYPDGDEDYQWIIARYSANGSLDTQFSSDGIVEAFECGGNDSASSVALQSDGEIIVLGSTHCGSNGFDSNFGILRLNIDGSIDPSFGKDGKVITNVTEDEFGGTIAIQSDGRILIGGTTFDNGARRKIVLLRYKRNGNIDWTFGKSGKISLKAGKLTQFSEFEFQSDGKILVAGRAGHNFMKTDFVVFRCDISGNIDTSFGSAGMVKTDFAKSRDDVTSISLNSTGFFVTGLTGAENQFDFAIAHYDTNGNLDMSFGDSGKVTVDFSSPLR
jgi:uncharacterized delta-60 repeat protein